MNSEARSFYDNEAFLTWQSVKNNYPKALHMDVFSDNSELRVFLSVTGKHDPTVEFINFSIDDSGACIDGAYILKNPFDVDFFGLSDEESQNAWEHYGCQDFLDSGCPADKSRSELYSMLLKDAGNIIVQSVEEDA